MLISKEFVFIHVPKTAGSFSAEAIIIVRRNLTPFIYRAIAKSIFILLKKCNRDRAAKNLRNRILNFACPLLPLYDGEYHGACHDIPEKHRHKKILSLVRDPMAYYVSCYHTGIDRGGHGIWWWLTFYKRMRKQTASFNDDKEKEIIPDFDSFLHFCNGPLIQNRAAKWMEIQVRSSIGFLTFIYIYFFFKNPAEILLKTDAELEIYFQSGEYKNTMYPVNFLHTENIARELHDFFIRMGFDKKHVEFMLTLQKINVNPNRREKIASYYNEELTRYVEEKDRIYYRYFYQPDA